MLRIKRSNVWNSVSFYTIMKFSNSRGHSATTLLRYWISRIWNQIGTIELSTDIVTSSA